MGANPMAMDDDGHAAGKLAQWLIFAPNHVHAPAARMLKRMEEKRASRHEGELEKRPGLQKSDNTLQIDGNAHTSTAMLLTHNATVPTLLFQHISVQLTRPRTIFHSLMDRSGRSIVRWGGG